MRPRALLRQNGIMADSSTDFDNPALAAAQQRRPFCALRQRRDFLFVQHNGIRQVMPHFILQAAIPPLAGLCDTEAGSEPQIRTGVTASKKIGNAIKRNRAKRRMRSLFGQLSLMQTPCRADYVLVARHSLTSADWPTLCAEFTTAAERVNRKLLAADDQERAL
ncbi:MAG: ribonuclease P protein component [Pseudomonadota bacterium]|nr:ribonuclease P protein component [Pseudomonadota bacterium]